MSMIRLIWPTMSQKNIIQVNWTPNKDGEQKGKKELRIKKLLLSFEKIYVIISNH